MARQTRSTGTDQGLGGTEALTRLLRKRLTSGEPLPPERTLAVELSVKRHRLRAALLALRQDGSVAPPRIGRRRRATPAGEELIRCTNPLEVIELRLVIEPALARLAALRASPQEVGRIERAATTAEGTDKGEADLGFHLAIAAGARNGLAAELYAQLRRIGRDARLAVASAPPCPDRVRERDAEHRAIANAIATRNADGAERAMRVHLLAVQRRVMERLSPGLTAA
jgi:GntR family transcriptional repressor for pyruvate dehydrogenase complex